MIELNDSDCAEYFHRSFVAGDGLWFMKVEERHGFEDALETDLDVWRVVPKIQARTLIQLTGLTGGIGNLREAIETKLSIEGFTFTVSTTPRGNGFTVIIEECPWHDKMVKAGREKLSPRIGHTICDTEYSVWAAEFGDNISADFEHRICDDDGCCRLTFTLDGNSTGTPPSGGTCD